MWNDLVQTAGRRYMRPRQAPWRLCVGLMLVVCDVSSGWPGQVHVTAACGLRWGISSCSVPAVPLCDHPVNACM